MAKFNDDTGCIKEQRKRLADDLGTMEESEKVLWDKLNLDTRRTHIVLGQTIFGFSPSWFVRMPDWRDDYFKIIDDRADLTPHQKELAKRDALLPEVTSTLTYFCAPTATNLYWPFHTPDTRFVAWSDLAEESRKILAATAQKKLSEAEQKQ